MQSPNNEHDLFFYSRKKHTNAIKEVEKKIAIQFLFQDCVNFSETRRNVIYVYFLVKIPSFSKLVVL